MLKELRDLCHLEVVVIAAQPKGIPDAVESGLSKEMQKAVVEAAKYISGNYF
jgi:Ni,Fe-hydrogenase maturation factor